MLITPLQRDHLMGAKNVIATAWNDVFDDTTTVEEWEKDGYFNDLNHFETKFIKLLVLLDGKTVVGCAGIKPLSQDTCELKRMWLLKPYRHLGWGSKLLTELLHTAQTHGLSYIRLEVYRPAKQTGAIAFYRTFGFYEIAPYCESLPDALFMEKALATP